MTTDRGEEGEKQGVTSVHVSDTEEANEDVSEPPSDTHNQVCDKNHRGCQQIR